VLTYQRTQASDAATVSKIRAAVAKDLTLRYGPGHWSEVFAVATIRKHMAERPIYLVGLDGAQIATFELRADAPFWYSHSWFSEPDAPAFYLFSMAVLPEWQRHGVGASIMSQVEEMGRSEGRQAIRFDAYDAPAGAGRFYQKCGYALVHRGSFNGVALEYYEKQLTQ
jgi:GNAT superfamily N-acetyltransferase